MFSGNTIDTTRIWGENSISLMINAFQMAYPGFPTTSVSWKPNAITIAPMNAFGFAFTAASLVHDPNKAPVLLVPETLTTELRSEIQRLSPSGKGVPAQTFLIGPVSQQVERDLRSMGLTTLRIGNHSPYDTSVAVSKFRLDFPPASEQGRKNLFILSGERFTESMFVPNYAMHQGLPVLLTMKQELPRAVQQFLLQHKDMNVYIVGSTETVSASVENEIRRTTEGKVTRITGSSPYDLSVHFSTFFDPDTQVGWNRNKKGRGDAFSFVATTEWHHAIISGLFSHLGKHAPLLVTTHDALPEAVRRYLHAMRPEMRKPQPPFMHGFVFGNFASISYQTQVEIEESIILQM